MTVALRVSALDANIAYRHLGDEAPELAATSTPDWMLYLYADFQQYDGFVTWDVWQLDQDTELIALALTNLDVVTWRGGIDDPVVKWGQLLAYMPQIVKARAACSPAIYVVPTPRWSRSSNIEKASHRARQREADDRISYNERRGTALREMRQELELGGKHDLLAHLARKTGSLP